MEINAHKNTFEGGMDMDTDVSYAANNTYRYAQNIRLVTNTNGTSGIIQNIEYIKKYEKLESLKQQNIIYAISAEYPYVDDSLQNCVILLTQSKIDSNLNSIYIVTDFNKKQLSSKCVLKINWNINLDSNVTMIYNYETKSVYKLYINDPNTGLKIINLNEYKEDWGDKQPVEDSSYFNGNPSATLAAPKFIKYVTGSLKAGVYQYFYKLYTSSGIESNLSSGTDLIYVGKQTTSISSSGGLSEEAMSQVGIQLHIDTPNKQFDRIRLYRVYWKDNINKPDISIITEDKIPLTDVNQDITDTTIQFISKVTIQEFNDIIPYEFKAQIMSSYKNRLLFANVESNDWDIPEEYDTRAYRCNSLGKVTLKSITGNNEISDVNIDDIVTGKIIVPKDADCINPMSDEVVYPSNHTTREYAFLKATSGGKIYGGKGPNISFQLVTGETYESKTSSSGWTSQTVSTSVNDGADKIIGGNQTYTMQLTNIGTPTVADSISFQAGNSQLLSYANPYIASKFATYQRDETYRFGIIFYNSKGVPSPVHWICDIRMPSGDTTGCAAFEHDTSNGAEVVAKPIGIKFTIENFAKTGATAAEIVRCDRTSADRSIVAQGIINNTIHYINAHFIGSITGGGLNPNESVGKNDIRASIIPTLDRLPAMRTGGVPDTYQGISWATENSVKTFASPEICMNPDSKVIQEKDQIVPVYILKTKLNNYYSGTKGFTSDAVIGQYGIPDNNVEETDPNRNWFGLIFKGSFTDSIDGTVYDDKPIFTYGTVDDDSSRITGGILKYYNIKSANHLFEENKSSSKLDNIDDFISYINDTKVARRDIQPNVGEQPWTQIKGAYIDTINSFSYTNVAVGGRIQTLAGTNALIGLGSDVDANHILYDAFSKSYSLNGFKAQNGMQTLLCNIKRQVTAYGGNSYIARATSKYISCGGYISANTTMSKTVFGGDTFLTLFDYHHAAPMTTNDWNQDVNGMTIHGYVRVYLPIESTINTYMREDSYFLKNPGHESRFILPNIGVVNTIATTEQAYKYNSVYSLSDGAVSYAAGSTNENITNNEYNRYRVTATEQKAPGEQIDSWTKTKFANTLDLDTKFGKINNLIEFKSQLYAFQQNAVSVLSIGDRSLITDNNGASLVLGTGGILERYDTVVQGYGTGIANDKSVIASSQNIYWYDNNKNVICSIGSNGFHLLSKEKKIQTFLNNVAQVDSLTARSMFNDKANELWMKIKGNVLVYNELADCFTSFYSHNPDWGLRFYDRLVTLKNQQFYYTDSFGEESEVEPMTAKLIFTVNPNPEYTKVYDNQWLAGNIEDPNNTTQRVINGVQFETKNQKSFKINYRDIDCREDTYRFPIPRQDRGDIGSSDEKEQDILNKSFSPRMRGKYMICHYDFDCNNDKHFEIPFIKTTFRQSMI